MIVHTEQGYPGKEVPVSGVVENVVEVIGSLNGGAKVDGHIQERPPQCRI
jgi:hypothetical protein